MQIYNVDFKKLALLLLPTVLRKPVVFAFLKAACKPFSSLQGELFRQREECNVRMTHTSQVCYMKAILNRTFCRDTGLSFSIDDTTAISGEWLMTYEEGDEFKDVIPLAEEYTIIYSEDAIKEIAQDFVVGYPSSIISEDSAEFRQMQAIVNQYRLAGKLPKYEKI